MEIKTSKYFYILFMMQNNSFLQSRILLCFRQALITLSLAFVFAFAPCGFAHFVRLHTCTKSSEHGNNVLVAVVIINKKVLLNVRLFYGADDTRYRILLCFRQALITLSLTFIFAFAPCGFAHFVRLHTCTKSSEHGNSVLVAVVIINKKVLLNVRLFYGADDATRTRDNLLGRQTLYQLSYVRIYY